MAITVDLSLYLGGLYEIARLMLGDLVALSPGGRFNTFFFRIACGYFWEAVAVPWFSPLTTFPSCPPCHWGCTVFSHGIIQLSGLLVANREWESHLQKLLCVAGEGTAVEFHWQYTIRYWCRCQDCKRRLRHTDDEQAPMLRLVQNLLCAC